VSKRCLAAEQIQSVPIASLPAVTAVTHNGFYIADRTSRQQGRTSYRAAAAE